jgi:predicted lipoprotein with Yx(FWY)xxD motif
MLKSISLALALAVALVAGTAFAAEPAGGPPMVKDGMYVNAKGMTLYTFDKDTPGKSACNGQCAINWPPLIVADGAKASGDWSIVTRDDGLKQWAYKGKPLYTWIKDQKPGDKTGDGVNKIWHVAKP